jgi:hypothetical protein
MMGLHTNRKTCLNGCLLEVELDSTQTQATAFGPIIGGEGRDAIPPKDVLRAREVVHDELLAIRSVEYLQSNIHKLWSIRMQHNTH